ncbi:PP2C family protein-serine/threonine phosphatase, partial [Kaarinaea lacus]
MQELLTFITELNKFGNNADSLIKIFGDRLRSLYGPCSIALISKIGLSANQCQVTVLVDETNTTVIADDHLDSKSERQPVYTHEKLRTVLNPLQATILRNDDTVLSELFGDLFQPYATILSLPLYMANGVYKWMFLLFINPTELKPVDIERLLLIATLATNLGAAVESTKQLQQANQWIADEINSVAKIQRQLLPKDTLITPGLNIASRFVPYSQVGGDYYDITELTEFFHGKATLNNEIIPEPKVWGFMIADASGHGSAAAVEIAMFDAILRTYPPDYDAGPAGVFNYANRHLFTRTIRGSFITAFVSAYLPDENVLSYCNAGHPPPLLKRHNKP